MRRRLSNIAFVVSLVAGALVLVLWVRSHWIADQVEWVRQRRDDKSATWFERFLRSEAGGLRVYYSRGHEAGEHLPIADNHFRPRLEWVTDAAATYPASHGAVVPAFHKFGFAWGEYTYRQSDSRNPPRWRMSHSLYLTVAPYWFLLLLASVLPVHRLVQTWRQSRRGGRGFDVSVA